MLPGYEYDIFISYRQKDNKGDRWVTEFVSALKSELEATFKEDISIYFDENPHDGLLETHHVDKTVEGKLKCLIFIPIISQTYCDTKSFAWQQEFCAFNKLAKEDSFGRDIKLSNGNVSSRILPIKIHSLDAGDQKALEIETGSALRAVEFIYREPGVNRPLSPDDDPSTNLNKTRYRNQVNKVANAIKEIISSLMGPTDRAPHQVEGIVTAPATAFPNRDASATSNDRTNKSIAVLPFVNMSNDPDQEYFSDGITEEILNLLANISDLRVTGRTSSFQFKNKQEDIRQIAKQLGVEYVLEGSVRKQGSQVRITAQLINAESGFHMWSRKFDRKLDDIFALQDEIAMEVTINLKSTLTGFRKLETSIPNMGAYDQYLLGRNHLSQRTGQSLQLAVSHFKKSVHLDPTFARAYSGLADTYILAAIGYAIIPGAIDLAKEAAEKAVKLDPTLCDPYVSMGYFHLNGDWNWSAAKECFAKAIEINPNEARAFQWMAQYCLYSGKYEEAIPFVERAREIEPLSALIATESAWPYLYLSQNDKAIAILKQALAIDNTFALAHFNIAWCYEMLRDFPRAIHHNEMAVNLSGRMPIMVSYLSQCLVNAGKKDEAVKLLEELIELFKSGASVAMCIALIYEAMGEEANAVAYLCRALDNREPLSVAVNTVWMPFKRALKNREVIASIKKLPVDVARVILESHQKNN